MSRHCRKQTYEHTVPTHARGRRIDVDRCIADIIAALNAANIPTVASCCGHGEEDGNIILEDGRVLTIALPKVQQSAERWGKNTGTPPNCQFVRVKFANGRMAVAPTDRIRWTLDQSEYNVVWWEEITAEECGI